MDRLVQILKGMNQSVSQSPAENCVCYLRQHSGWDLITLAEVNGLIDKEFHYG